MIVRFWQHVPAAVALEAIHQVLDASQSSKGRGITLNATSGTVRFSNEYDYRVFELLPALRQLDDGEADRVLSSSQQAQSWLQQFPNGIQSINPAIRDTPPKEGEHARIAGSVGGPNSAGRAIQQAYNSRIAEIVHMAEDNPQQAIARQPLCQKAQ